MMKVKQKRRLPTRRRGAERKPRRLGGKQEGGGAGGGGEVEPRRNVSDAIFVGTPQPAMTDKTRDASRSGCLALKAAALCRMHEQSARVNSSVRRGSSFPFLLFLFTIRYDEPSPTKNQDKWMTCRHGGSLTSLKRLQNYIYKMCFLKKTSLKRE